MADIIVAANTHTLLQAADFAAMRTSLGVLGYTLTLMSSPATVAPADSATYYWGGDLAGTTTAMLTYANGRVEIPKAGTIKRVYMKMRCVAGTGETTSHWLRLNDTTDVAQMDTTYDAITRDVNNTSVSQAVIAGDYIAMKIVTPAWVTNPTSVRWYCVVYIE